MRAAALVAIALTVTVCSAGAHGRPQTWSQAAAGLRPQLDRHSADPCERGDLSCVDLLLVELRRRAAAEGCRHRALFTNLYLGTTEALRAAANARRFHDPAAIVHFAAWFARFGFQAEDAWASGRRSAVPPTWQVAFSAEDARRVRGLGDLLLGMNGHISRDLAVAVATVEHGSPNVVDPDFALFTEVIQSRVGPILTELAQKFDPTLVYARVPLALGGARTLGQLIGVWRTEAWRNGIDLRNARGAARAAIAQRIEQAALLRADAIVAATAYVPLVQSSRDRDAYCAAHAGS